MSQKKFIGIDVSSKKLNIHITDRDNYQKDFEISNDKKSLEEFIKKQKLTSSGFTVGCESTSRYHLICQEIFVLSGYEFRLLNPILTGKKIICSIRKKKTDISDSRIIANLLIQGEGNVITKKQLNTVKRSILRTRKTIVNHRTAIKVLTQELKRAKDDNIQIEQSLTSLQTLIDKMTDTVKELEAISANCEADQKQEKLIRTIPGFAVNLSAIVSSEVGDFNRFPSATQLKAYVGIDPKVTQSGDSLKNGRITKRGNVHLRSAFYLAAQVARNHDPELKQFYQKKISEGKPTRVAICAVARKLVERVYAVVTKGIPYEIKQPSFS